MPRLMSCSITADAVEAERKDMTRRLGWWTDKRGRRLVEAGDRLWLCRKVMGRRRRCTQDRHPGPLADFCPFCHGRGWVTEPLDRLKLVEVTAVRREALCMITDDDIARECVPVLPGRFMEVYTDTGQPTPAAWVEWFAEAQRCDPYDDVTVIEWRYLDQETA